MMQSRFFYILAVVFATVLLLSGLGVGFMRHLSASPSSNTETQILFIESGASVSSVAKQAAAKEFVRAAWHFKLTIRWRDLDRRLHAGEYEIPPGTSLYEILSKIEYQDTFKRRFVVPEGASVADVDMLLRGGFGLDLMGYSPPSEGSLLPETYYYERGDSAVALIGRMQTAMSFAFDELWRGRSGDLPFTDKQQAVILASIVEKETGVAQERPLVAAVFVNRLKKNMRLQSDPTVIYGISGGTPLGRALTRRDLRADTPFNSYRRGGLPPTPIANPGEAAIAAVLNPANVPYLYFVADGTGGHAFATTLAEHNKNVARWRLIQKNVP